MERIDLELIEVYDNSKYYKKHLLKVYSKADIVIADITTLNQNAIYESVFLIF